MGWRDRGLMKWFRRDVKDILVIKGFFFYFVLKLSSIIKN